MPPALRSTIRPPATCLWKARFFLPAVVVLFQITHDPCAGNFRNHAGSLDDLNDVFDSYITTDIAVAIPASLVAAGYARHDNYQVNTALLAGLAYADSAIVDLAVKAVTRRERTSDVPRPALHRHFLRRWCLAI